MYLSLAAVSLLLLLGGPTARGERFGGRPSGVVPLGLGVETSWAITTEHGHTAGGLEHVLPSSSCLRLVEFLVRVPGHDGVTLELRRADGAFALVPGARTNSTRDDHDRDLQIAFRALLPPGSYGGRFVDAAGSEVFPPHVLELWKDAPSPCHSFASAGDVTLSKPFLSSDDCSGLVEDEHLDGGVGFWQHNGMGIWRDGDAVRSGASEVGQYLSLACLRMNVGARYEIRAKFRLRDASTNEAVSCDASSVGEDASCPAAFLHVQNYRDAMKTEGLGNGFEIYTGASAVSPLHSNPNRKNLIHGIFTVDERMATADRVFLFFTNENLSNEMILDDISVQRLDSSCADLTHNGDLAEGVAHWHPHGRVGDGTLVGGIGGGTDLAFKVSQRTKTWMSPGQDLKVGCFLAETRYIMRASYRLTDPASGEIFLCSPYVYSEANRCPEARIRILASGESPSNIRAGLPSRQDPMTGWGNIAGVFTATSQMEAAYLLEAYFEGVDTALDVTIDNLSVVPLPQDNCESLILNGDFEDDLSFFQTGKLHSSEIGPHRPGFGGVGHAIKSFARDSSWRGISQQINAACMMAGQTYEVTMETQLFDSVTGEEAACDMNTFEGSDDTCPSFSVYGAECGDDGESDVWFRRFNDLPHASWNLNGFNAFRARFAVSEDLATCSRVYAQVVGVRTAVDIVIDNFSIVKSAEPSFTLEPTPFPTVDTVADTASPTMAPTVPTTAPTVNAPRTQTACPSAGNNPQILSSGYHSISIAPLGELCTLTKVTIENETVTAVVPVARSYNGYAWENAAGMFANDFLNDHTWRCSHNACDFFVGALAHPNDHFLLSNLEVPSYSDRERNARFLEAVTFGITKAELQSLEVSTPAQWIQDQINVPHTSHREFFRKRMNTRWTYPQQIGVSNHPCSQSSRWRGFAFIESDMSTAGNKHYPRRYVTFEPLGNDESAPFVIRVEGKPRTVVNSIGFLNSDYQLHFNQSYEICDVPQESIAGDVHFLVDDGSCQKILNGNPRIDFENFADFPANIFHVEDSDLRRIDVSPFASDYERMEFISTESFTHIFPTKCASLPQIIEDGDESIFARRSDGSWLIHDPRLVLEENRLDRVIPDGGGLNDLLTDGTAMCANAARTPFNAHTCILSNSSSACGSMTQIEADIELVDENILTLHEMTGRYIYAIDNLPVVDVVGVKVQNPCIPGLRSRWEIQAGTSCNSPSLSNGGDSQTIETLFELLSTSSDTNPFMRDITFPANAVCNLEDPVLEIQVGSDCFVHRHPDWNSVFDMTYWTVHHPGGAFHIKKWVDEEGTVRISFPSWHSLDRWETNKQNFKYVGRLGDNVHFRDLPQELRAESVAKFFGSSIGGHGDGIVVCGSPDEVSNDPSFGDVFSPKSRDEDNFYGTRKGKFYSNKGEQKEITWTMISLTAPDQLRQRIAWALSQILVTVKRNFAGGRRESEAFLGYYDLFVKNAFGNYRTLLKEVSFHPHMAEHLSYLNSKSHAYVFEQDHSKTFADENFAREVMQLFTIGLHKLNIDGTPVLSSSNRPELAYTNEHIISFARAWTGFTRQDTRGNIESGESNINRMDPLRIISEWRDKFPKIDLHGGFIGDKFPLCVDLPSGMFLRKGATYRLLGSSTLPEFVHDNNMLAEDETAKRMVLPEGSQLKELLTGQAKFQGEIILESNLQCHTVECDVDTIRVVQVYPGIFYEYIEPPCVEKAFYNNAMTIHQRKKDLPGSMCANPFLPLAAEACCSLGSRSAIRNPVFDLERVTFSKAEERCNSIGLSACDFYEIDLEAHKTAYHWSARGCKILAKIEANGNVAIVHEPAQYSAKPLHVSDENENYFPVPWTNNAWPSTLDGCGPLCEPLPDGSCMCEVTVREKSVFENVPASKKTILAQLHTGAPNPALFNPGTYLETDYGEFKMYTKTGDVDASTIFEVLDDLTRQRHFLKNVESTVIVQTGTSSAYSFRNPVSFMSLVPTEASLSQALHETDAVLDEYVFHENVGPFLALRFIQRFGISNPSPRYVRTVATAFQKGHYESSGLEFGSGEYGDLEASFAAVFLDREARDPLLDADPVHGSIREPILKVLSILRTLEYEAVPSGNPLFGLKDMFERIGQMAHDIPTVFNFYLPEHVPASRLSANSLTAPESQLLDAPKIVNLLNGIFSMLRFGLSNCKNGFGHRNDNECRNDGNFEGAGAIPTLFPAGNSSREVVSELSLLLTAGRLHAENHDIVQEAYEAASSPTDGLIVAQQLIATTPEFHTTGQLLRKSGKARSVEEKPEQIGNDYKAIIYVMFGGGCDSFNMLAPYTCTQAEPNLRQQYESVREHVALPLDKLALLNATGSDQACEAFGVHKKLSKVAEMYESDDALFVANVGVLTKPTTKDTYGYDTETQLFAHNTMQRETKRVDPFRDVDGSGVLGRLNDALAREGYATSSISVDSQSVASVGEASSPTIVGRNGVKRFNSMPSSSAMDDQIRRLNGEIDPSHAFFADTWSSSLVNALAQNEELADVLDVAESKYEFPDTSIGRKLEMVSKLIAADRGTDRDVFYVSMGGFDTHSDVQSSLDVLFEDFNAALDPLIEELKFHGLWDSVVLVQNSEFGRTLSPNSGDGTDHGWGGNTFILGGSVNGGRIVGSYPDLAENGSQILKRGRVIPTTPYDAIWHSVAQWAGVHDPTDLSRVCPNAQSFEYLFEQSDLFQN